MTEMQHKTERVTTVMHHKSGLTVCFGGMPVFAIFFVLIYLFCGIFSFGYSQIIEDFSDGDLGQNPAWMGDLDHFVINERGQLQLKASDAGLSSVWFSYPSDSSMRWELDLEMHFAPSNNNNLIVVLYMDRQDFDTADGYYIKIGENGSDDTVEFYALVQGDPILLAMAEPSIFAGNPVRTKLVLVRDREANWSLFSDKDFSGTLFREFTVFDDQIELRKEGYFGIRCKYTKSNVEGFYFDNIRIAAAKKDTLGPQILSVDILSDTELMIRFDEAVLVPSAVNPSNYVISGVGMPETIALVDARKARYKLSFGTSFENGAEYTIFTTVEDIYANTSNATAVFKVLIPERPERGDVLLHEVLFNPNVGGEDFVEILNNSEKYIALNQLQIINNLGGAKVEVIQTERILNPGEIICFSKDIAALESEYSSVDIDQLVQNKLPALNADTGNVTLVWFDDRGERLVVDSFNYSESWHHPLLSERKGVSLERIQAVLPTVAQTSWASASGSAGYATPGLPNSQEVRGYSADEEFVVEPTTFSPDGDGMDDYLLIRIKPEAGELIGRVQVFDSRGRPIKELANNLLLGTQQTIRWDGTDGDGQKAKLGAYLIKIDYFDTNGRRKQYIKSVILASRLN